MKLATVSGALSGNSVQVMLPSVVWMIAVGSFGVTADPWELAAEAPLGLGSRQCGQAETKYCC